MEPLFTGSYFKNFLQHSFSLIPVNNLGPKLTLFNIFSSSVLKSAVSTEKLNDGFIIHVSIWHQYGIKFSTKPNGWPLAPPTSHTDSDCWSAFAKWRSGSIMSRPAEACISQFVSLSNQFLIMKMETVSNVEFYSILTWKIDSECYIGSIVSF
jgi:hypothetical protein